MRTTLAVAVTLLVSCSAQSVMDADASVPAGPQTPSIPVPPLSSEVIVGGSPCGITHWGGSVWVSDLSSDRVVKVDAATGIVSGTFPVGRSPCWMLGHASGIWVAPSEEGFLQVLDPATGRETARVDISGGAADAKLDIGFGRSGRR